MERPRGHAWWSGFIVAALTTVAVGTLGDADAAVPAAAALVSAGAVAAVLVVVFTGLENRHRHPYPLATLLWRLSPLPIAVGLGLLAWAWPKSDPTLPDQERQVEPQPGGNEGTEPSEPSNDEAGAFEIIVGVLLFLVAALLVILVVRRLRRRTARAGRRGRPGVVAAGDPEDAAALAAEDPERRRRAVLEGLARGRTALLAEDDPRLGVVQAYLAFEDHVQSQGFAREPTETQREFVGRVLAAGRVTQSRHARPLVELFNVARFSELSMTPADARAAREHLDAMVGDTP